jgi:hypothetical protein
MSTYQANPELKDVSDEEIWVRFFLAVKIAYVGWSDNRVLNPLTQAEQLLQELIARKSLPKDQVVSLNTLHLSGETHIGQ